MITFLPRDIGRWRDFFDFSTKERPSKQFNDVNELKNFCRDCGFKVDSAEYPFHISDDGDSDRMYVVVWTVIGWIAALLMTYAYEPPPPGSEPDRPHVPGEGRDLRG